MGSRKTRAELKAENRMLRQHYLGDSITKVLVALIRYGAFAFISWQLAKMVIALAGHHTEADIQIGATLNVGLIDRIPMYVVSLALFLALVAVIYAKRQAKLRRQIIERFHPYQEAAEKQIDPKRSSSRLTKTGDTRPEDKHD